MGLTVREDQSNIAMSGDAGDKSEKCCNAVETVHSRTVKMVELWFEWWW